MGSFTNKTIQIVMAMAEGVFSNGANQITVEGLPTSVNIQKQGGDERPSCEVTIGNLNIDVVRQLTTLSFRPLQRYKNQITAQHGALTASPATSVDGTEQVSYLMEQWAREAGCTLENNGVNASVRNAVYSGSPVDKAKALAREVGIELIIDDNKFIILPKGKAVEGNAVLVDKDHGLLGYPTFSNDGIEFRSIFDPTFRIGGLVKVTSIVPRASGTWKITKLNTKLEAYMPSGGAWESSISATFVQE